jgi:pyrrolidone-carboxylate peptidase
MLAALQTRQAPFSYSIDARDYVCNHTYFLALDRARSGRPVVPCLFVHTAYEREASEIRRGACIVLTCVLRAAGPHALSAER